MPPNCGSGLKCNRAISTPDTLCSGVISKTSPQRSASFLVRYASELQGAACGAKRPVMHMSVPGGRTDMPRRVLGSQFGQGRHAALNHRANPNSAPIYHRDARGTIRLRSRVGRTIATDCLDGKVQTTWHLAQQRPRDRPAVRHHRRFMTNQPRFPTSSANNAPFLPTASRPAGPA
jgi:hypothetical protein